MKIKYFPALCELWKHFTLWSPPYISVCSHVWTPTQLSEALSLCASVFYTTFCLQNLFPSTSQALVSVNTTAILCLDFLSPRAWSEKHFQQKTRVTVEVTVFVFLLPGNVVLSCSCSCLKNLSSSLVMDGTEAGLMMMTPSRLEREGWAFSFNVAW